MKCIIFTIGLLCFLATSRAQAIQYIDAKPFLTYHKNELTSTFDTFYCTILTYRNYYGPKKVYYEYERYIFKDCPQKGFVYTYSHHRDTSLYRKLLYSGKLVSYLLINSYFMAVRQHYVRYYYPTTHTGCVIYIPGQNLSWTALFVLDSIPARKKYESRIGDMWIKHTETHKSKIYSGYYEYVYEIYERESSKMPYCSVTYIPTIGIIEGTTYSFFGLKKRKTKLVKINGENISEVISSLKKRKILSPCDVF